ncbi:MAG: hypothetical protein KMY53_05620 [Desulfarculus sp.]|nr:hypothetical protein [Pseudomonadota bacterium]MBV1715426.1 hypothetical protein [Desulfarculus sp.]MBU4574682.1 hypothetical protein [Pseudomonadota bacterium]MBU4596227.1 hypothetical protein [Pseudomonadota bacterium]MBV1737621.1 hypothetical protein [Desulfarculus sp.]
MRLNSKHLITTALLGLCLLLPGCFDCGLKLILKSDGSGNLSAHLEIPASLAGQYQSAEFKEIIKPEAALQRLEQSGLVEFKQSVAFTSLSKVEATRMRFSLERIDKGLLGIRDDTYRLTGWLRSLEGDRPDRDQALGTELDHLKADAARPDQPIDPATARANELLTASLAGRFLIVSWQVPGKILDVWKLNIGGRLVNPQVRAEEGKVTWRIPLALLATANVRHNLVFRADFKGDVRTEAGDVIPNVASAWGKEDGTPAEKPKEGEKPEGAKPGGETVKP